jgi:hypothetical protein
VSTSAQLEAIGSADTPWNYYCPPGLLVVLAVIEFLIIVRGRRFAKLLQAIGGGLFVISLGRSEVAPPRGCRHVHRELTVS